ncbi:hypothetical protein GCK72_011128 [Caenorhabditis remanei]|uniref:Sdz-33 F-box domain-containing protein n=1 Tax=Caenorhabditis remanei TaxID=31234 RepID=A0A6A5H6Y7_CAERE|nr:hypothetical protein GCK72_011128 [Caenorhabditis remanei]KAF1762865.1 hypothetical protein GCK72_011128 [Caenorhabditis remanei]
MGVNASTWQQTLMANSPSQESTRYFIVRIEGILIQIEMNGRKVHALLDTGAGISYLPVSQIKPEELDNQALPLLQKISTQINNACLYSQKVIVDLDWSGQKIRVHSENHEDSFEILIRFNYEIVNEPKSIKIVKGRAVSVISYNKGIKEFWKNHQEGFLSVVRYLLKMFRCKISIDSRYYNIVQLQPAISELIDLQLEFKKLTISFDGSKDDENLFWNKISSNFRLVEDLIISYSCDPAFRPVFTSWPQNIDIRSSAWFTLKSLLTCTCTTITLWNSILENKDLDVILKKWKAGGFPNLKCLMIFSPYFTDNGEQILRTSLRELDRMVIQTDDGSKKATLRTRGRGFETGYSRIEMSVTSF